MKTKISIFLLLILLFSSCENGINHSDSKQNNSSSHTSEKSLVVVSGSLKIDKNTVHEKSTARNAIPSVPYVYSADDDYEYFVQAISSNGLTHEVIADPENSNRYEISLEWGERWSISAGMRKKADNSIIMLDVDGFKDVNENYGHEAGDRILKTIADSLQSFCRTNNMTLGRYGGDEFLIFCPGERLDENSKKIIDLKKLFSQFFSSNGINVALSASIGISNSDGLTYPEQHIINAEIAMYEAKERGRGMVFVYADEMKQKVSTEENIKTKFIKAIEENGFCVKYQPKISVRTKELVGFEALVRMKDGSYEPNLFIPVVEKSGWIARLGRNVTFMVIRQLSEWKAQGKKLYPVSINFSSKQIHDIGYVSYVRELLDMYDIDPRYLEIEVTESLLLENSVQTDELFNDLKKMGIKLLLDDFGTGYSSLAYLIYVPVDEIKLDKSIVDAYLIDGKESFIEDVIKLAHDMGKKITIEGVEYEWQYEKLRTYEADTIQGFYFSKPLDPDDALLFKVKE